MTTFETYDLYFKLANDSYIRQVSTSIGNFDAQCRSGSVRAISQQADSAHFSKRCPWILLIWALNELCSDSHGHVQWWGDPVFGSAEYIEWYGVPGACEQYDDFHVIHRELLDKRDETVSIVARTDKGKKMLVYLADVAKRDEESRDHLTQKLTAFKSFHEMLTARGGYRPTIMPGYLEDILAAEYDAAQIQRGDLRRAYPERSEAAKKATKQLLEEKRTQPKPYERIFDQ